MTAKKKKKQDKAHPLGGHAPPEMGSSRMYFLSFWNNSKNEVIVTFTTVPSVTCKAHLAFEVVVVVASHAG